MVAPNVKACDGLCAYIFFAIKPTTIIVYYFVVYFAVPKGFFLIGNFRSIFRMEIQLPQNPESSALTTRPQHRHVIYAHKTLHTTSPKTEAD